MKQISKSKIVLLILLVSFPHIAVIPLINLSSGITPPSPSEEDCIDAWIIVCGDRPDHELSSQIWLTSQWVYHQVQACGVDEDDIYYLVADYVKDYTAFDDAITSDASFEYAFQTWAPSKVGENGFLGVYIVDHGGTNSMAIAPHGSYTAAELAEDLDGFEAASGCDRMLVIYEACSAGTFLDEASADNRIIISSTAPDLSSYLSPTPPNRAMFADNFFPSLVAGNSVGQAFVDANNAIVALGYGTSQKPYIEDNHDSVGHPVNGWGGLPNLGDGIDANTLYPCAPCQEILIIPPYYFEVPLKIWFEFDPSAVTIPVSVKISNTSVINTSTAHVRVVPTNWEPPIPTDPEAVGGPDQAEDTYRFPITLSPASGKWEAMIELFSPARGDYNLCFIVEDVDGYRGPVASTQLGLNSEGEPPADTVDPEVWINNPLDGAEITEKVTITAGGSDDNSGLEDIQLLVDGAVVETAAMPGFLPYPEATYELDPAEYEIGEHNITAIATDNAGNTDSFSIVIQVPGNPIPLTTWLIIGGAAVAFAVAVMLINSIRRKKKGRK